MTSTNLVVNGRPGKRPTEYLVVLNGKLTLEHVFKFEQALQESQAPATILDLTEVSQVDSTGLGAIVRAHVSHVRAGRKLVLVGVTRRVELLLEIAGLNPIFTVYESLEKAEAALA